MIDMRFSFFHVAFVSASVPKRKRVIFIIFAECNPSDSERKASGFRSIFHFCRNVNSSSLIKFVELNKFGVHSNEEFPLACDDKFFALLFFVQIYQGKKQRR
jgi:hypothetical protein